MEEDGSHSEQWERGLISRLTMAAITEQRRSRRWGVFFKLLIFGYLFAVLYLALFSGDFTEGLVTESEHTAVVKINGLISDASQSNAEAIISGLQDAFEAEMSRGVVLRINSPGGSAVQSAYVYDEIRRLRSKYPDKPLHAVILDVGASGAYYIAAAAENIYVNHSSIVGSIGVLINSFGFVGSMEKLGVERRLLTAGEHKGILDPFTPMKEGDKAHVETILEEIHQRFIDAVKEGRGDRLKSADKLYSGLFWSGEKSIELGLADEIGSVERVAREVIGFDETVDYTHKPDLFERLSEQVGATIGNTIGTLLSGVMVR